MKVFRPIVLSGPNDKSIRFFRKKGEYGFDGIRAYVNNKTVFCNDFSSSYLMDKSILVPILKENFTLIPLDTHRLSFEELNDACIDLHWYSHDFYMGSVLDAWKRYKDVFHFERIVNHLIARDIILAKVNGFINPVPSWEICLLLPQFMKLCEDIPGFDNRLEAATEVGEQIKNSLVNWEKRLIGGAFKLELLDNLLEKLHALSDELEMAYSVRKLGYEVQFGDRGGPDYIINGIAAEHKSRFPDFSSIEPGLKAYTKFNFDDALAGMLTNVKVSRGLKKADIYFTNMTRLQVGMVFYCATLATRSGNQYVNIADLCYDFKVMMDAVMRLQAERGKVVVPYVKQLSSDPRIIASVPFDDQDFESVLTLRRNPFYVN